MSKKKKTETPVHDSPEEASPPAKAEEESAASPETEAADLAEKAVGEVERLQGELEAARQETAEAKDRAIRAVADLENVRRRMQRERGDLQRFGAQPLLESLLPALDNLELGLTSAREHHPEAKGVVDGFDMVLTQMKGVLREHGVEEIVPEGEPFDPNLHEAVAHSPSEEVPENHVLALQRKGYRLHDRLLRAATVVVSSGPPAAAPAGEQENARLDEKA